MMLLENLWHAARNLRRAPGFATAGILSLALGIGGNVAIFSVINTVLLKPLDYPDPQRLVVINEMIPKQFGAEPLPVKTGYVRLWRNELRSFETIGSACGVSLTLTGGGQAERIGAVRVTAEFLSMLATKPHLGRWFTRVEEEGSAPDVVILAHSLWQRRFSADPDILSRTILLDGKPYQVVGIAPAEMRFPYGIRHDLSKQTELFIPLHLSKIDLDLTTSAMEAGCATVGRLKRGTTLDGAYAELEVSMSALSRSNRQRVDLHSRVEELRDVLVGGYRKGLLVILAAVGFVLLMVCVNVANLTLVRATSRRHELAIRAALGAGRRHLLGASMAESALMALGGTMAGMLLAWWIVDVIIASVPADLGLRETTLDSNVLGFAIGLCGLTAILFGLLPAWRISRMAPLGSLQAGSRGISDGPQGGRLRTALVSTQVALSTLLLIGAGLLLTSFQHVMSVPRGFEVNDVIGVDLSVPETKYRTFEQKLSFFRRVKEEMAALPGVRQLAYSSFLPLIGPGEGGPAIPEGTEKLPIGERPFSAWHRVGSEYFAAMGTPMLAGRTFEEGERELVAVVSQTAAQRLWPEENPIGKKFRLGGDPTKSHWFRVVGELADLRFGGVDREPLQSIYLPYWQVNWRPISELKLVVRTSVEPKAIAAAIREKVRNVDRDVAVGEIRHMARALSDSVARRRFQAMMLAAFALIALMLAATGIYGVVAYNVAQRCAEMGMRMALGARPRDVTLLILRQGMKPVLIGLAAGLASAAVLTRFIASLLFEVRPLDSLTFATVPVLLSIIGVLACYWPARQAGDIDPMAMLRLE